MHTSGWLWAPASHLVLLPPCGCLPPRPGPGSVTLRTSHRRFSYNLEGLRANSVGSRRKRRRKRTTERMGRKKRSNGRKRSKGGRIGRKEKMRPEGQRKYYKKKGKMRKRIMRKKSGTSQVVQWLRIHLPTQGPLA